MSPTIIKKYCKEKDVCNANYKRLDTSLYMPAKQLKLVSIISPQKGFYNKKIAHAI